MRLITHGAREYSWTLGIDTNSAVLNQYANALPVMIGKTNPVPLDETIFPITVLLNVVVLAAALALIWLRLRMGRLNFVPR